MTTFGPYPGIVREWHDGDTCRLDLDLGFHRFYLAVNPFTGRKEPSCRIWGINAPELSTGAGKEAKAFAESLLPLGTSVSLTSHGFDDFGRYLGQITLPDGRDFSTAMLEAGQAVPDSG